MTTDADLAEGWHKSKTRRYRTPEATVFITTVLADDAPTMIFVSAGKSGGKLAAQADGMARLAGAACRVGAKPHRLGGIIRGISHSGSNGDHWDARSVVDALGQVLEAV